MTADEAVDRGQFESSLHRTLAAINDPAEGLFGPDSVVWTVSRYSTVNLLSTSLGGYLDAAHPWIAYGVSEHSKLFSHPKLRFEQTYSLLARIVYGDAEQVRRVSNSLHSRHSRVTGEVSETAGSHAAGSAYAANHTDALLWVHLVYFWTRYRVYELTVGTLPETEWDQYVAESKRFGSCFGLPDETMPSTLDELRTALDDFANSDRLASSAPSEQIYAFLGKLLPFGSRTLYRSLATHIVPDALRPTLGMPVPSARTRAGYALMVTNLRLFNRFAPGGVRYLPGYHEATARLGGRRVRTSTRLFNRALVGRPDTLR
jgi:uncharacterized protein (DUF2236 family)